MIFVDQLFLPFPIDERVTPALSSYTFPLPPHRENRIDYCGIHSLVLTPILYYYINYKLHHNRLNALHIS